MTLPPGRFRVGEFEVEPRRLEVRGGDTTVKLEPKVMGVLVDLVTAAGETRTKEEILDSVWPDVTVGEAVLSRSISLLRSTLHDDPKSPRYIETIPRIGYRFVGDVAALPNGGSGATGSRAGSPTSPRAEPSWRRWLPVTLVAAVLILLGWLALRTRPAPTPDAAESRPLSLPTLLTSAPGAETAPSVSADGRLVVYAGSPGPDAMSVYLLRLDSGEIARISSESAAEVWPVFSPTADRVAWMRHWGDRCEIVLYDLARREERVLSSCGNASIVGGLDWSPDGEHLAIADGPGAASLSVVLLSIEDGSRTPLTEPPGGASDTFPKFSPDGRRLAYTRHDAVRIRDLGNGSDREVFAPGSMRGPLAWSPDGSEIFFARGTGVDTDLWAGSLDGRLRLIPGARGGRWPATYPGGLVFGVVSADSNLTELDLASGTSRVLRPSTRAETFPTLAPDGALTFVSGRSGAVEVWVERNDQLVQVTHLEAEEIYRPRWSPDGERLVFAATRNGRVRTYLLHPAAGTLTEILGDGETVWSGAWTPDGRSIYYTSDQGGDWGLYRHDLAAGRSIAVGVDGTWVCDVGAADRVYFVRDDRDGIYVWDPNRPQTEPRVVVPDFNRLFDFWNWAVDGDRSLLAVRRDDGFAPVLMRYSIEDGLASGEDLAVLSGITWASGVHMADDERVLLARIVRRESDLYRLLIDSGANGS